MGGAGGGGPLTKWGGGEGDRFVMTLSDVFLPVPIPKGPNLEKIQDRLKISISLENFNLA